MALPQKSKCSYLAAGIFINAPLGLRMINYTEKDGALVFKVRVVPRASRSELVGEHDGALRVRIAAPPVDGAANDELVRLLARAFGVPRGAITITGGHAAKLKTVCVAGGRPAVLKSKVQSPMS